MQRIDVYIQNIAVFVNDAHCFLELAVYFEFLQAAVTANTMIDMRYTNLRAEDHEAFFRVSVLCFYCRPV